MWLVIVSRKMMKAPEREMQTPVGESNSDPAVLCRGSRLTEAAPGVQAHPKRQASKSSHFRLPCTDYNPYEVTLGGGSNTSSLIKGGKKGKYGDSKLFQCVFTSV